MTRLKESAAPPKSRMEIVDMPCGSLALWFADWRRRRKREIRTVVILRGEKGRERERDGERALPETEAAAERRRGDETYGSENCVT